MAEGTDERADRTCQNPPCSCPVSGGDKYCSIHCESTAHHTQIECDCGHQSCGGDV